MKNNWPDSIRKEIQDCSIDQRDKLLKIVSDIELKIQEAEQNSLDSNIERDLSFLSIPALRKLNKCTVKFADPEELPVNAYETAKKHDFEENCKFSFVFDVERGKGKRHQFDCLQLSESFLLNDFDVYRANVKKPLVYNPASHTVFGFKNVTFPVSSLLRTYNGYGMVCDDSVAYQGMILGNKSAELLNYFNDRSRERPKESLKSAFVVPGYAKNGFYHFIVNSLPAIFIYKDMNLNCPVIFPYFDRIKYPEINSIIKKLFRYLGIDEKLIVDSETVCSLRVEKIIAPKLLRPCDYVCEKYKRFADYLGCYNVANCRPNIYITRHGQGRRPIVNEISLERSLRNLGFDIVSFDKLNFEKQVSCIANSNIVVSPHGAGLSNLVFGNKHTFVVELNTKPWNTCFSNLSALNSMDYIPINVELASGESYKDPNAAFAVDILKVENTVKRIIEYTNSSIELAI